MEKLEMQNTLKDVRSAYRLLYEYQKRILDLMNYMSTKLGYVNNPKGYSQFSGTSPSYGGKVNLNKWAWDWLSMYFYDFHFGTQLKEGGDLTMSIQIQSDTGYFDAKLPNSDKLNTINFVKTESSETRILFIFGKNGKWTFDNSGYYEEKGKNRSEWSSENFYIKAYNLIEFIDNNATDTILNDLNLIIQEKLGVTLISNQVQ